MVTMITNAIQREFRPAISYAWQELLGYFGSRLQAVYLTGSVAYGEALPGVSDVDWFMFLDAEPSKEDLNWCHALRHTVLTRFPVAADYLLTPHAMAMLEGESFWRFALRYNALRLYGVDLLATLEARGITIDAPSRALALGRLGWMQPLLASLRAGCVPEYLFDTPETPCLFARKLARYFVLVEGAYLLMLEGQFISFRALDVLPSLRIHYPEWEGLYKMTDALLLDPYTIDFSVEAFISALIPFFEGVVQRVEISSRQ